MPSSYPYTPTTLRTTVKPRPWVPFKPHEGHVKAPSPLPFKPRSDDLLSTYNISTHVIPAANPRVTPNIPVPEPPPHSSKRTESDIKKLGLEFMEWQAREGEDGYSRVADERLLWNCVNRYVKKDQTKVGTKGITLFLVHAVGYPKEIWEANLRYLLAACGVIDEIWSWESVQHGDSALLNRDNLSGSFDWTDNARDIINFLVNYIPEEIDASSLPVQLHRVPASIGELRQKSGFSSRTFVVAGHSYGGCSVTLAALHFPALFSSMILVDAMIDTYQGIVWEDTQRIVGATLIRRDQWLSREDTLRSFQSSPVFSAWHPDVLCLYVDFGLYEDETGCVRLKTPPVHEALVLANPQASRETWELIEKLDEKIELLWILPGNPTQKVLLHIEVKKQRAWRRPANSSNIILKSSGHLIPQESPEELARVMADFLHRKYGISSGKSKL